MSSVHETVKADQCSTKSELKACNLSLSNLSLFASNQIRTSLAPSGLKSHCTQQTHELQLPKKQENITSEKHVVM